MLLIAQLPPPLPELRSAETQSGDRIVIGGQTVSAPWLWQGRNQEQPERLWLPMDLLESRLGFRRSNDGSGDQLEWFSRSQSLTSIPKRTLGDDVALDVGEWLLNIGVASKRKGTSLELSLPRAQLQKLRRGKGSTANRVVLDLNGPLFVQQLGDDLLLDLQSPRQQLQTLQRLGLTPQQTQTGLRLRGQSTRLRSLTLAAPWRLVLDGVSPQFSRAIPPRQNQRLPLTNPAIAALIRRGLVLERRTVKVGVKPLQVVRAGGDLSQLGLKLSPLAMTGSQQGLRFLTQLSRPAGALIAVNGGFFNRIQQLPLGALRLNGAWLSGPILNRGVVAWDLDGAPAFGRLLLNQELRVADGRRWGLGFLNSGYVQRGLSRYTSAWGPMYRALSGQEQALLIQDGRVIEQFSRAQLNRGVPIPKNGDLIVARGRAPLPASQGDHVTVVQRSSTPLGDKPNVLGGGPLLIQNDRIVLNGRSEGFSPGFLALAAPRTVVGHGRTGTWFLTLRGAASSDPTLLETALAAKQLGLSDALNLDGGSSTTLVAGGRTVMNGSGSAARIHNGLGFVPDSPLPLW